MGTVRASVAVSLLTLLLTAAAASQIPSPTGDVHGTVLDEQGKAISGVIVTLTGPGAAQTVSTSANGDFHFQGLSPGAYSVVLALAGFATTRRDVAILIGKNTVLTVTLPVAGTAETVTVSGEAPIVDTRKTQTGANFSRKELDTVPTTRDIWAILRQTPGVLLARVNVGDAVGLPGSALVSKGADLDQNVTNIDGVPFSIPGYTPQSLDFDSFEGIGIATGGSDPSLQTPGATVNLVTKRGTNALRGSARVYYTDGAQWDFGFEAGGPIWKDRLWFWGAGGRNSFLGQTAYTPEGEPAREKLDLKQWNAKLNAQLLPGNDLTVSYVRADKTDLGRFASPDRSAPSTMNNEVLAQSYRVADSQVLSADAFASFSASSLPISVVDIPIGGVDAQAVWGSDEVWRNSYLYHLIDGRHKTAGLTASNFFTTGALRHELKFGFGYQQNRIDSISTWPGDQLVGNVPFGRASVTRPSQTDFVHNWYDSYLADTFQLGNLTVNAGLRFDYQQGKNLPSSVPASPVFPELLPAVNYAGDKGYPITWRQLQPRVGATYAIGTDGRTLIRASYSQFANQLAGQVVSVNAFPELAALDYYWNDTNGNQLVEPDEIDLSHLLGSSAVNPRDPGSSTPVNRIAADFKPPRTTEFIVGVERQISSDFSASLAYTHRSLRNPEFSPLKGTTRASYQYLGNASGTATSSGGFALSFSEPYYGPTTDPAPDGTQLQNRPDYTRPYDGVELQLIKAFSHGWMLRASFAYNDWRQNVGPGAIVDPNNQAPGTNASGPVVAEGINATWQFNVSGMAKLPLGIVAAMNLFGRQGFPIIYSVEVLTHDSNNSTPNLQIGPATAYRLPNVVTLDLRLERSFTIGPAVAVTLAFDCFNLLNSRTVLAREGSVGSYDAHDAVPFTPAPADQFNAVGETLSGRTLRGGLRVSF